MNDVAVLGAVLSVICLLNMALCNSTWQRELVWVVGTISGAGIVAWSMGMFA